MSPLRPLRFALLSLALTSLPACAGSMQTGGAAGPHDEYPLAERGDPQGTLVSFESRDADLTHGAPTRIEGVLFRPQGEGPFPAVVLLHGCGGLYDAQKGGLTGRHREWAYRLRDLGYVVLMPDSFNPRGVRDICHRSERGDLGPDQDRARDAFGALAYLATQPFVKADRVGLMGWSHGSMTTLATIDTHAKARAAAQPMTTDFRVAVAFYPGCKKIVEGGAWDTKTPLTILMGESDNWTIASSCIELVQRARAVGEPAEIVLYPGAYHEFDAPDMPLHELQNIPSTRSHTATVGTDPAGRADAFKRVPLIFDAALKH